MKLLSKTDFVSYKDCPNNVWIKWHNREEYDKFPISEFEKALGLMGQDVEEEARKKFPGGYLVKGRDEKAQELTKKLIEKHEPVIFQAVFATKRFLAASDVLKWNEKADAYDIYEIKMSAVSGDRNESEFDDEDDEPSPNTAKEKQYIYDLAFQSEVAKLCGINFNKKYLLRLNRKYIKNGELDISKLFSETDRTENVDALLNTVILTEMNSAFEYLIKSEKPKGNCRCYFERGRKAHCTTFKLSNPNVPDYSVHDLNRIGSSKKYLAELLNEGVLNIENVPMDDRLLPKPSKNDTGLKIPRRWNQVKTARDKTPIIDSKSIKKELANLKYPLYFLDYETNPEAIPKFNGYHPYQHVVFQYSLHIVNDENSEPIHKECLVADGDPAYELVKKLREDIGDTGTIISWFKKFENSRNKELAQHVPQYADFLKNIIDRTYDLMDIVDKQYFVHHGFKGSASIKMVQQVIAPDFSYKKLKVKNGTDAIDSYRKITGGELNSKETDEIKMAMLKYCEYDTLIMYKIWKYFVDLVKTN